MFQLVHITILSLEQLTQLTYPQQLGQLITPITHNHIKCGTTYHITLFGQLIPPIRHPQQPPKLKITILK